MLLQYLNILGFAFDFDFDFASQSREAYEVRRISVLRLRMTLI